MKKIVFVSIFGLIIAFTLLTAYRFSKSKQEPIVSKVITTDFKNQTDPNIIADNLELPWALVFLPDKSIMFTERPGRVRFISSSGILDQTPVLTLKDVKKVGEGGLLGIALHPQFIKNNYVYLYYTYSVDQKNTLNKVVRYTFTNKQLTLEKIIINNIPGNVDHNGGTIKFGPDNYLYITTGDTFNPSLAQDNISLAGKILKVTDEGQIAPGNPFNNPVYTYGHQNPQGLAWDSNGQLWSTENGSTTGDEINLIEKGNNYGWPIIQKNETKTGMKTPILNSGNDSWSPAGLVFIKPFLYFVGVKSSSLFRLGTTTMKLDQFLKDSYGRLRDVINGPDGMLYLTTANMDGHALTHLDGDKIVRINPLDLQ